MKVSKGKKIKKTKKGKVPKEKQTKKTDGFPELVSLVRVEDSPGEVYFEVHPIDFSDINEDKTVAIFKFRRVVDVKVIRKIARKPKDK